MTNSPSSVLHIIAVNGIGGAEKLLTVLLPALQQENIKCSCLLFFKKDFEKDAIAIGKVLTEKNVAVFHYKYASVSDRKNLKIIRQKISEIDPSIIHTHLKHAEIWLALLKWRRKIKIPVVTTLHGYRDQYHNVFGLSWNKAERFSRYYLLSKFIYSKLDGFIAISNGIANFFKTAGLVAKKNAAVIYHGAEVHDMQTIKLPSPKPNFALVGRLVKFKGHGFALEAISLLKKKYPSLQLHFYGSGPEEQNLRNTAHVLRIEENVFFHGFVNGLHEQLSTHSIALMPSIGEPFGLVFFDNFKAGLPTVAFDLPSSNEIIEHNYNGLLAAPMNAQSFSEQIERLLTEEQLYKQIQKNAINSIKDNFTIGKMVEQYIAFYHSTLKLSTAKVN